MSRFGILCGMTLPMLSLPTVFLGALNLVMVPRLARAAALGRKELLRAQVSRSLTAVSVLILPAMALMVVLGPELAVLIFREPSAGDYLLPLAAAVALSSFRAVYGGVLSGVGKQGQGAVICLVCDVVQLVFVFSVALPGVGLKGFVAGTVLSELLGAVLCARCTVRATGIRLPVFQSVTAPTLSALLAGLTGNLLFRYLRDSQVSLAAAGERYVFIVWCCT
jgi:O-antigen/teichoic acid export membrane protein